MGVQPLGLHHVTAVAGDPQGNVDFYLRVLGLRLVKTTVNFDAPDTYHLYYGDTAGTPGTIITFFPWPGAPRGRRGAGQATTVSFAVPPGSMGWWTQHLASLGHDVSGAAERLDGDVVALTDPDGLVLELVASDATFGEPWAGGPVPEEHAIRGVHSVTFTEDDLDATAGLLTDQLGFRLVDESGARARFDVSEGGAGARVDVVAAPGAPRGLVAAGTVHHVAWRAPDEPTEASWREDLVDAGLRVTEIIDRQYFKSIYFREPGGVLLEIATDPPGFTRDEPLMELGRQLKLPAVDGTAARPDRGSAAGPEAAGRPGATITAWRGRGLSTLDAHRHVWRAGAEGSATTLLLLHGTGGDEHSLLPLAVALDPAAAVLAVRGSRRWRAPSRGSSAASRAVTTPTTRSRWTSRTCASGPRSWPTSWRAAASAYGFDPAGVVAVGFSNGANAGAGLLLHRPDALRAAILASPNCPWDGERGAPDALAHLRRPPPRRPPRPDRPAGAGRAAGGRVRRPRRRGRRCAGTTAATSFRRPLSASRARG